MSNPFENHCQCECPRCPPPLSAAVLNRFDLNSLPSASLLPLSPCAVQEPRDDATRVRQARSRPRRRSLGRGCRCGFQGLRRRCGPPAAPPHLASKAAAAGRARAALAAADAPSRVQARERPAGRGGRGRCCDGPPPSGGASAERPAHPGAGADDRQVPRGRGGAGGASRPVAQLGLRTGHEERQRRAGDGPVRRRGY